MPILELAGLFLKNHFIMGSCEESPLNINQMSTGKIQKIGLLFPKVWKIGKSLAFSQPRLMTVYYPFTKTFGTGRLPFV